MLKEPKRILHLFQQVEQVKKELCNKDGLIGWHHFGNDEGESGVLGRRIDLKSVRLPADTLAQVLLPMYSFNLIHIYHINFK